MCTIFVFFELGEIFTTEKIDNLFSNNNLKNLVPVGTLTSETEGWVGVQERQMAQTTYTHMSK
jgi:hypothetical protein